MRPATLYLASQSPRRRQLLEQIGLAPTVLLPANAAEAAAAEALEAGRPGETPARYVRRVTRAKLVAAVARLAAEGLPSAPVLCADTTVALGGRILGKPTDARDAAAMLRALALAGATHRVLTAVALHADGGATEALSISRVTFAPLSDAQVAAYVASGEWQGKAGGYGIQGRAGAFVAHLSGSYSGVMGLPLCETARLLAAAGVEC